MTTVYFEHFEQRSKTLAAQVDKFNLWCKMKQFSCLTEWMEENSVKIHELYGAGLIDYIEMFGPVE